MASTANLSTIGVKLGYSTSGSSYTDLPNLLSTPDMGGDPEQIDVTCLADSFRRYIDGVQDYGTLEFIFLYDGNMTTSSWNILNTHSGGTLYFELELPDGATFTFSAIVAAVTLQAAEVNAALQFKLSLFVQDEITYTAATA